MLKRARVGFVVGIIGLILNEFISGRGITGTILSLIAGGVASFLAARLAKLSSRNAGARIGALAGGIASGVVLIGQVIGAMVTLSSISLSQSIIGKVVYVLLGAGIGIFLWIVVALLAAGMGAIIGYFVTPSQSRVNNPPA